MAAKTTIFLVLTVIVSLAQSSEEDHYRGRLWIHLQYADLKPPYENLLIISQIHSPDEEPVCLDQAIEGLDIRLISSGPSIFHDAKRWKPDELMVSLLIYEIGLGEVESYRFTKDDFVHLPENYTLPKGLTLSRPSKELREKFQKDLTELFSDKAASSQAAQKAPTEEKATE